MVNSRFEYVKEFEREERLLPETYIVTAIHGTSLKRFCASLLHPFDDRLLRLFSCVARHTMENFSDIGLAYGYSDHFYFVFRRSSNVFNRRRDKILSNVVSLFVSSFTFHWDHFFEAGPPGPPEFRATLVLIPRFQFVREFLLATQKDAAATCAGEYAREVMRRAGVVGPETATFAEQNELLFTHGINYNCLPAWHKRGRLLLRKKRIVETSDDLAAKKPDFWKKVARLLKSAKASG
jgi:tRNA(His) guanylyltransferase